MKTFTICKRICLFNFHGRNPRQTVALLSPILKRQLHGDIQHHQGYSPVLKVTPKTALYDVRPTIRVEGLKPQTRITLKAQMVEDKGNLFHSNGHFIADKNGIVDVSSSPSLGGSYEGVFATGLLTTLQIATGTFEFTNVYKENMFEPVKVKIILQNGHQHIDSNEEKLDSTELNRYMIAEGVQRIPVREGNIRGVLYIPKGEGPFPGVIDMFGATGTLIECRAALNASRGISSLCLSYYNYEDLPASQVHNLDLSYFEEAMEYLLSHPKVISDHCGVVANCFGGCLGYRMALHFSELKAVFLINTTHNPYLGKFTYKGKVIAECPGLGENEAIIREDSDGFYLPTESYKKALSTVTHSDIEAFEKTDDDQHFLIAIGEDDCYQLQDAWYKFEERLSDKKRRNLSLKIYPKAGHIVHTPYSPFPSVVSAQSIFENEKIGKRILVRFGGEPKETVFMQEDVWKLIPDFIHTHITNNN